MRDFEWRRGQQALVKLPYPLDNLDPSDPVAASGGTHTAYLYDAGLQSEVAVAAAASVNSLTLVSDPGWTIDDVLDVQQDDGTRHSIEVETADPVTKIITFSETTTDAISVGARAIRRIGGLFTGSEYGTPSATSQDWGYVAHIPWNVEFIDEVQNLIIEQVLEVAGTGAHFEEVYNVLFTRGLARP